jgi:hypothetical protein
MVKKVIESTIGKSLISGLILLVISKGLDKYGGITMRDLWQNFFIEIWYVWFGVIGFLISLIIMDYIKTRKLVYQLFCESESKRLNKVIDSSIHEGVRQAFDDIKKSS